MAIPSVKDIEIPLLKEIEAAGGEARPSDLCDRVALHFSRLTLDDQEVRLRGVQPIWANRVHWARLRLVNKGELDASTRGIWRITDKGRVRLGVVPPPSS